MSRAPWAPRAFPPGEALVVGRHGTGCVLLAACRLPGAPAADGVPPRERHPSHRSRGRAQAPAPACIGMLGEWGIARGARAAADKVLQDTRDGTLRSERGHEARRRRRRGADVVPGAPRSRSRSSRVVRACCARGDGGACGVRDNPLSPQDMAQRWR